VAVAFVAVQLVLGPDEVGGPDRLEAAIAAQVDAGLARVAAAEHRLVVVPEAIGLAAMVALAPVRARAAGTLAQLLARSALRRPLSVLRGALDARTLEPRHAALVGLAPDVDRWVRETLARIARRHDAHVVGGSHLRVDDRGDVIAASHTFGPDGRLLATTDKVNLLVGLEDRTRGGLGLARGSAARLPRITTPFGAIAVLIGYDAFVRADTPHERFTPLGPVIANRLHGVAVVANPAASPWGWDAAFDADGGTCAERWRTRGLAATLAGGPVARWGVTAHLVGRILDLVFEGESAIVRDGDGGVEVVARAGQHDAGGAVTWIATELG
jgi:predicted amidohydrolase